MTQYQHHLGANVDTGLIGLSMIARFHGTPVNPDQLRHEFGIDGRPFGTPEMSAAPWYASSNISAPFSPALAILLAQFQSADRATQRGLLDKRAALVGAAIGLALAKAFVFGR